MNIYECVDKKSRFIGCSIWMICLELNRFFYDSSWILQFSELILTLRWYELFFNNFLLIEVRLVAITTEYFMTYPYTPFHFLRTLPVKNLIFWRQIKIHLSHICRLRRFKEWFFYIRKHITISCTLLWRASQRNAYSVSTSLCGSIHLSHLHYWHSGTLLLWSALPKETPQSQPKEPK